MAIQVSDVLRNFQPDYPVVSVKDGAVQGFWNGVDSTHQVGIITSPTVIDGTTYQTERYLARTDTGQVVSFSTTRGPYADNDAIIEKALKTTLLFGGKLITWAVALRCAVQRKS